MKIQLLALLVKGRTFFTRKKTIPVSYSPTFTGPRPECNKTFLVILLENILLVLR